MLNSKPFLVFSILSLCSLSALAQKRQTIAAQDPELAYHGAGTQQQDMKSETAGSVFSPSVAKRFYEIAHEIACSKDINPAEVEQAIVLLKAARNLDSGADYTEPLLIRLASQASGQNHSPLLTRLLVDYVGEKADLVVVRDAILYLLERLNSREQREELLKDLLRKLGGKNAVLDSELVTLLGLLAAEKPDLETAKYYFMQAYNHNKYNKLAFTKLTELVPEQIGPGMYLEQLRLALRENPSDIGAAVTFADYLERLELYSTAARAYEYCADLFSYLYPSEALPANIYLPWVICCYHARQEQKKCLQIAQQLRQQGIFDIFLEGIAGKAAEKMGDTAQATQIFQAAEAKAQQLLLQGPAAGKEGAGPDESSSPEVGPEHFAWFYCFAHPEPSKALDWANKAYAREPNSAATAALLAYSLVMNQQTDWAKPLLNNYKRNQTADLAFALIQLKERQKDQAIETLKSAIAKEPGSLVAEQAKDLLSQLGSRYSSPVDPNVILAMMNNSFGESFIPAFTPPEKILQVQLNVRGNRFYYGSKFDGTVAITNNSSEPLIISDDGLFQGNIRLDAEISGDLKYSIPKLISRRIVTAPLVEPGGSLVIPLQLLTGQLRQVLLAHPQATLDIEFTLYLDPVTTAEGKVTNRLVNLQPVKVLVQRPGIELSSKYLLNRFNTIARGKPGQKIQTAQLFIGLLMEQQEMARGKPLYRYMSARWVPNMLRSALTHETGLLRNPDEQQWVVRVHTMADMLDFPLDRELMGVVAENLNNPHWPVRLMAVYLLAKSPGSKFGKVLDWTAKQDSHKLVRDMAMALGATGAAEG